MQAIPTGLCSGARNANLRVRKARAVDQSGGAVTFRPVYDAMGDGAYLRAVGYNTPVQKTSSISAMAPSWSFISQYERSVPSGEVSFL